jgi:hypothetical protein
MDEHLALRVEPAVPRGGRLEIDREPVAMRDQKIRAERLARGEDRVQGVVEPGRVEDLPPDVRLRDPSREPKRAPSPFALSPRPAEFAPRRPTCPASVCITIVGDGGCSIRSITTVSRVPARQSQVWPQ